MLGDALDLERLEPRRHGDPARERRLERALERRQIDRFGLRDQLLALAGREATPESEHVSLAALLEAPPDRIVAPLAASQNPHLRPPGGWSRRIAHPPSTGEGRPAGRDSAPPGQVPSARGGPCIT